MLYTLSSLKCRQCIDLALVQHGDLTPPPKCPHCWRKKVFLSLFRKTDIASQVEAKDLSLLLSLSLTPSLIFSLFSISPSPLVPPDLPDILFPLLSHLVQMVRPYGVACQSPFAQRSVTAGLMAREGPPTPPDTRTLTFSQRGPHTPPHSQIL